MLYVLKCTETNDFFTGHYDVAKQPIFHGDIAYLCDTLDEATLIKKTLYDIGYYVGICEVTIKP